MEENLAYSEVWVGKAPVTQCLLDDPNCLFFYSTNNLIMVFVLPLTKFYSFFSRENYFPIQKSENTISNISSISIPP